MVLLSIVVFIGYQIKIGNIDINSLTAIAGVPIKVAWRAVEKKVLNIKLNFKLKN